MRKLMTTALLALVIALPLVAPGKLHAESQVAAATATDAESEAMGPNRRLLVMGAGAIVGIVVFNMLTYPLGSVPFVAAPLAATPVDIALGSRVLATLVAGAGALATHYWYTSETPAPQ